jgi:uncharacterized protein with HEPN domain
VTTLISTRKCLIFIDRFRIPWREIIGQRNILAHEYGQIDHEILYKTATEDVPDLIVIIQDLLPPLDEDDE